MRSITILGLALVCSCAPSPGDDATADEGPDRHFDSDGVQIRYQVTGSGPPVVLIHGYTSNLEFNWGAAIPVLAEEFQVIAMDARGHGKSGKPHDADAYGLNMVEDVVRLLDHLGLEKAHIVGYSMGGAITLKMAELHPDRMASAVMGGQGMLDPDEVRMIGTQYAAAMDAAIERGIPIAEALMGSLQDEEAEISIDPETAPSEDEVATMIPADNDPRALKAAVLGFDEFIVAPEAASGLTVPMLALYGDQDDPLGAIPRLKAAYPAMEVVVIPGLNHVTAPNAPQYVEALRNYLAGR